MGIIEKILKMGSRQNDNGDKVIDLSDSSQYPASVLADLDCTFALGDDSQNFLTFLHGKWTQPTFHWGWDDITHEDAVKSEFLQRAFYGMDCQNKKRRDAMIASEGYQFVWKDKGREAVPGFITGEELCRYLTRSREWGLKTMKDINAREDRDARRWCLNPTFEDLMADWEKSDDEADYYHRDMGYGMLRFSNRSYGNKQIFIVNPAIKKVYPISGPNGSLVGFTLDDIDWDNVNQLEHNYDAKRLVAEYGGLSIGDYQDGVAYVSWMLYPDGRYFADEDGFGMEDNDEVNIGAYIDTQCHVVVKFQDLEDDDKRIRLRREAVKALSNGKSDNQDNEKDTVMNDFEKKALEFVLKKNEIVRNKCQEKIDSLFSVLDCLSLRPGCRLGLKLAGEIGIGDESWFYTYQGEDPIDTLSCRVPESSVLFKDIIVEQSAMGHGRPIFYTFHLQSCRRSGMVVISGEISSLTERIIKASPRIGQARTETLTSNSARFRSLLLKWRVDMLLCHALIGTTGVDLFLRRRMWCSIRTEPFLCALTQKCCMNIIVASVTDLKG